jgi:hypothetical protein
VVDQQGAARGRGARQQHRQPGVVELAVPVLHAAGQAALAHGGQQLADPARVEELGVAQAAAAGQHVVGFQADAVEAALPPLVARHHEGQPLRDMGRVGEHRAALLQRFAHQADVALRQVAHTAVRQLGGARRGALREVVRFDQHHAEAAHRRVERHTQAGGAAADHRQVPLDVLLQARQQCSARQGLRCQCGTLRPAAGPARRE